MYAAKTSGRSRKALFDAEMHSQSARRLGLISGLRDAVDGSQFTVEYQPIVTLGRRNDGRRRSLNPMDPSTLGKVSPSEFIPLAEEVGTIVPIGRFVLAESCRRYAEWMPHSQTGARSRCT